MTLSEAGPDASTITTSHFTDGVVHHNLEQQGSLDRFPDPIGAQETVDAVLNPLESLYPDRVAGYRYVFERLMTMDSNTGWLFPDELRPAAAQATRQLFADTAAVVGHHLSSGEQTKSHIPLLSGRALPFTARGTEPLRFLDDLSLGYWMAGEIGANQSITPVLACEGEGYRIYRFIDLNGRIPPCSTLYIRKRGSDVYDPAVEYGRPNYGVEASVALSVDVDILRDSIHRGKLSGISSIFKDQAAKHTIICLRNDREGGARTDPHRKAWEREGTFSHDVATILGSKLSGGTQAGRLLALGNLLSQGPRANLNHLPVFPREYGSDDIFAAYAESLEAQMEAKRIKLPGIRRLVGRPTAEASKGFANFELGDNPYDIGGGAVRQLAHASGIELAAEPSVEEVQQLYKIWGSAFDFRANIAKYQEAARGQAFTELVELIGRTGIMDSVTLRTIDGPSSLQDFEHGLLLEGTAGWMSKRTEYLIALANQGVRIGSVVLGATDRPLTTITELMNPDVIRLQAQLGREPVAADYMRYVTAPRLQAAGIAVKSTVFLPWQARGPQGEVARTTAGDITKAIAAQVPEIQNGTLIKAENAPAGAMFLEPMLALGRAFPEFEARAQFHFGSTATLLARRPSEVEHSTLFQNPYSAPSSLVRWINAVCQVNDRFSGR